MGENIFLILKYTEKVKVTTILILLFLVKKMQYNAYKEFINKHFKLLNTWWGWGKVSDCLEAVFQPELLDKFQMYLNNACLYMYLYQYNMLENCFVLRPLSGF